MKIGFYTKNIYQDDDKNIRECFECIPNDLYTELQENDYFELERIKNMNHLRYFMCPGKIDCFKNHYKGGK